MNKKQINKLIKDLTSIPYVPDKPDHEPRLSDYQLTEKIITKNEDYKKKYLKRLRIIIGCLPIIGLLLWCFDPWATIDKYNNTNYSAIGMIGVFLFAISITFFLPYLFISSAPETEIDKKLKQYNKDLENWKWWNELYPKKKVLAYWYNLNGYDFEREVAIVFTSLGFNAKITPKSNDGGVDIILKMGNKTTYVQCKAFKSNVGVAVVRELYGVMQSDNIKSGIVVTLNGFSQGAIDFAEGKNIELITAKDLISMIK